MNTLTTSGTAASSQLAGQMIGAGFLNFKIIFASLDACIQGNDSLLASVLKSLKEHGPQVSVGILGAYTRAFYCYQ